MRNKSQEISQIQTPFDSVILWINTILITQQPEEIQLPIERVTINKGKSGLGLSICATKVNFYFIYNERGPIIKTNWLLRAILTNANPEKSTFPKLTKPIF